MPCTSLVHQEVKPKFHLARHVSTRHVHHVQFMHFGRVELVEQHGSTCSSRRALLARHIERVLSCQDVTRRAKWNLGFSKVRCRTSMYFFTR